MLIFLVNFAGGPSSTFLREAIDELEGKCFTMQDPNDTSFFVKAMEIATNHLRDLNLADKIHKLLLTGENYDFIGEGFKVGGKMNLKISI